MHLVSLRGSQGGTGGEEKPGRSRGDREGVKRKSALLRENHAANAANGSQTTGDVQENKLDGKLESQGKEDGMP